MDESSPDEIDWRSVTDRLRAGQAVEIPCATEREYLRRTKQVARRAGQQGFAVEVMRMDGGIRVEPRGATDSAPAMTGAGRKANQEKRRGQRERRRGEAGADSGDEE